MVEEKKFEIEVNKKTWKKAKRIGERTGRTVDQVAEDAIKKKLDGGFEDRYFPDKESMDDFKERTEPFEKLRMTVKVNPEILNGDFPAYQKFQQLALISYVGFLRGMEESMFVSQLIKMRENKEGDGIPLIDRVGNILENAKIFNLDQELSELIEQTDIEPHYSKTPFRTMFINQEIELIKGVRIFGIGIYKSNIKNPETNQISEGIDIVFTGRDFRDDTEFYQYFQLVKNGLMEVEDYKVGGFSNEDAGEMQDRVASFVTNLLELLNHPEIEYELVSHGMNQNRVKRGKLKINDKVDIIVKGKLYRYIYETIPRQRGEFTHKFWIRGHFKHFRNRERFCQIYNLSEDKIRERGYQRSSGIICKWVLPYIKGKGRLKEKEYNLRKK